MRMKTPLDIALEAAEDLYVKGLMEASIYYKCLVALSHQALVDDFDTEKGLVLLNRCPPEYFKGDFLKHMEEDEQFAALAVELTYHLIKLGLTDKQGAKSSLPTARA